jgi:exosortase A-associated hydrolase 1
MKESVLTFACDGQPLVGILAEPDGTAADIGVLIVVGGPQYRAGSHRQFTLLARELASQGFAALRFDYRGMGDSLGEARDFEQVDADIDAALDALLEARPAVRRVVIWGLCDAASAALMYMGSGARPRVAGLVLANPWVRSTASLAATQVKHYYGRRLLQRDFWRKLLAGGVGTAALSGAWRNLMLALSRRRPTGAGGGSFQARMAAGLAQPSTALLVLLSATDMTAREFDDMFPASQSPAAASPPAGTTQTRGIDRRWIAGADHTFSTDAHHRLAMAATVDFLRRLALSA